MKVLGIAPLILGIMASLALAQSQSQQPQPVDPTAQAPSTKAPPPTSSTRLRSSGQAPAEDAYVGEVILIGGTYYLRTGDEQYKIENQAKGKQYAGRTVQVKGTVDQEKVLHIQSITAHE